jgi:hypothetical protein
MKKLLLSVSAITLLSAAANAQCTPVNCQAELTYPDLGGVCDTMLMDAVVNTPGYNDFESFLITSQCFDAGLIDESQAGTDIKITTIDNFTYSGLPNGITGVTSQPSYSGPSSGITQGCVSFTGNPTEIGVFNLTMSFLADVQTCGFISIPLNDNAASYVLWLTVKPVPTFSGLASNYCVTDGAVTLTPTGTTGGTFSGPGVSGNTFNPATAGVGTHQVKYLVSAQQGAAIAPAADSLIMTVEVFAAGTTFYQDADNDTYGDLNSTATGCTIPAGYVANSDDCDDADPAINPGATDIPDNGIDEDCSGSDAGLGLAEINNELLNVYPNPTTGVLTIDLSGLSLINSIEILDLNGRIIETKLVNAESTTTDLTTLKDGFYFVKVNTIKGSVLRRVALQH